MRKVILEGGKALTLKEKNDKIYKLLAPTIAKQAEKENMAGAKMIGKFTAIVSNKLLEICRTYGLMDAEDVMQLKASDLQDFYVSFMELINRISETLEITPTKPLFCAYMGTTTNVFNNLEKSPDGAIRMWIDAINGDFTHSMIDSSMHGNADRSSALAYAATKNYGQEIVKGTLRESLSSGRSICKISFPVVRLSTVFPFSISVI